MVTARLPRPWNATAPYEDFANELVQLTERQIENKVVLPIRQEMLFLDIEEGEQGLYGDLRLIG